MCLRCSFSEPAKGHSPEIEPTRKYTGAVLLDISHGSMASRTAEGFYKTLINGADYLCDYLSYWGARAS